MFVATVPNPLIIKRPTTKILIHFFITYAPFLNNTIIDYLLYKTLSFPKVLFLLKMRFEKISFSSPFVRDTFKRKKKGKKD